MKTFVTVLSVFVVSVTVFGGEARQTIYFNDFETSAGTEWTLRNCSLTPSGRRFLGEFGNTTTGLTLNDLPSHNQIVLSFDLFIIRSWDGSQNFDPRDNLWVGPDIWELKFFPGATTLCRTTFSNVDSSDPLNYPQAYPDQYGRGLHPPRTDAAEVCSLGYSMLYGGDQDACDSVYLLSFTFNHTSNSVALIFSASGLQAMIDESWGLDNVLVEIISQNQVPEITHTPVFSSLKDKDIPITFEVNDPDNNLSSVELFYKKTGDAEYQSINESTDRNGQYTLTIPAAYVTALNTEYYIKVVDDQNAARTIGSEQNPFHVEIVERWPVIIIPGILGSNLYGTNGDMVWLDWDLLQNNDTFLLRLLLDATGELPDTTKRCSSDLSQTCNSLLECEQPSWCEGGEIISVRPGETLNIPFIFTSYVDLYNYLAENNYKKGLDLFLYSYDWRFDIEKTAKLLRSDIETSLPLRGKKIDIIAHSMGGLLIRSYIQQYLNDHRLNSVTFLGTPQAGSPLSFAHLKGYKPILKWMEDTLFEIKEMWNYLELETIQFIVQNFPSIFQTLPRYDFITRIGVKESFQVTYGNEFSNQYFVDLASQFHTEICKDYPDDIKYYSILGTKRRTLSGFEFRKNGCVAPFLDLYGDGTVPLISSTSFQTDRYYYSEAEHQKLPGDPKVKEKIIAILQGNPDKLVDGIGTTPLKGDKGKLYYGCCPIHINVSDDKGNTTGVDESGVIKEMIPGSSLFLFEENEAGYLPYDGDYLLEIHGTGNGRFTLMIETQEDNQIFTNVNEFNNIPITSGGYGLIHVPPDESSLEMLYDLNNDKVFDFSISSGSEVPDQLEQMFVQRGDVNHDGFLKMDDVIGILGNLFLQEEVNCIAAGDLNGDASIDISDAIYILFYLFAGDGEEPKGIVFCQ